MFAVVSLDFAVKYAHIEPWKFPEFTLLTDDQWHALIVFLLILSPVFICWAIELMGCLGDYLDQADRKNKKN
jgi:hypothetical protein